MAKLTIKFHQSLRLKGIDHEFSESYNEGTILDGIKLLLEPYPNMAKLCLQDGKRKPGILYLSGRTELSSLGLLDERLTEDLTIRIIPILHGGSDNIFFSLLFK